MARNSTGTIAIGTPVVGEAAYSFAPADAIALLSQIPAGGTVLSLPEAEGAAESYDFVDVDGTCSSANPITLQTIDGETIQGATSLQFTAPFSWGRAVWSGDGWALESVGPNVGPLNPPANGSWSQRAWFIDEAKTLPTSSDNPATNNGATPETAIITKRELFRRWGTLEPFLDVAVTVTFLSVGTAAQQAADPWAAVPILGTGGQIVLTTPTLSGSPSFTGTLLSVTPKSTTTTPGTGLKSTFTTTGGTLVGSMLLVNTTRGGSQCFANVNLGAGVWQLSQPFAPVAVGAAPPIPGNEVDTWANGDAIEGFVIPIIDAAAVGCSVVGFDAQFNNGFFLDTIGITGGFLAGFGFDPLAVIGAVYFVRAICEKAWTQTTSQTPGATELAPVAYNSLIINNGGGGSIIAQGGSVNPTGYVQAAFLDDVILFAGTSPFYRLVNPFFGRVNCDRTVTVVIGGFVPLSAPGPAQAAVFYGSGTLNVLDGTGFYTGTATNAFRCAIELAGKTTGYSMATSAGTTTIHGGIALSGPNIDAAAGAAGFGGTATNLAGASLTNGVQP